MRKVISPFNITEAAVEELQKLKKKYNLEDGVFVRINSSGSSKSGIKFSINFDDERNDSESVYKVEGLNFLIDGKTLFYLNDYEIDFSRNEGEEGFVFKKLI